MSPKSTELGTSYTRTNIHTTKTMTTKKYCAKKSYISIGMIVVLQCGPLLTLTSYASESEPVALVEQTISNEKKEIIETLGTSSQEVSTEISTPAIPLEETITGSAPKAEVITTTSTPPTPEEPKIESTGTSTIESTGTSTAPSIVLFSNASSSFEGSTTSQEEVRASSTEVASSTALIEEVISHENTGDLPSGTTTISTGSSVALANILNITNTNLINSTGSIILENLFTPQNGDLDIRLNKGATSTPCTLLSCNGIDSITAKITAESTVDTTVSLIATSGSNEITTVDSAIIDTGNVYAGLNLVNIANTTLVDSHYLLLSLNSFGNFNGDIIFPSLSNFFSSPNSSSPLSDFGNATIQTNATITNNLNIGANAGENTVGSSTGFTQTGSTNSSLNLYNNTNSTLLGGNSLLLLLKVTGTWLGNLVGIKTPMNFIDEGSTRILQLQDNLSMASNHNGTFLSSSTALLTNNVEVLADSGKNITTDTNTSQITTGDAYASANIINIANTHIIGHNWVLAIITIFGDFTGNIAFGRPDLWVGEQVSAESIIANDTELLYRVTVINKGDSNASNVVVTSSYDANHLDIINSNTSYSEDAHGKLVFSIGNLGPEESKEITFHAKIKESTPGIPITNTVTVQGDEKDNNTQDNIDTTTITTTVRTIASGVGYQYIPPEITILAISPQKIPLVVQEKPQTDTLHSIIVVRVSTSTIVTTEGTVVEQTILIKNPTQTEIPSVIFNDFLIDENGKKIKKESWDIGSLLADEEVTLTYSLSFESQANRGVYTLSSEVLGTHSQNIFFGNNGIINYLPKRNDIQSAIKPTAVITSLIVPQIRVSSQIKKVTLESLIRSNFIETAYAENEAEAGQSSPFQPTSSSLQYVILFAAFSILRLFRKHPKERIRK